MTAGPVRVGMIGTGWMADAIAPDFHLAREVELVAVAGRDQTRTAQFAQRHQVPRTLTARQLVEDPNVDLVYLATTHESHFELALMALMAGKNVLVEKAFTVDSEQAVQLVDLARSRRLFLMEAMWMRFNPVITRMMELIHAGAIGEPRTTHASFGFAVPTDTDSRLWDPARAGGTLLDQGVYPLALADLIFGEPDIVRADVSALMPDGTHSAVDTDLSALLSYNGSRSVAAQTSIRTALPLRATVGGSEGWLEIGPAFWCPQLLTVHRGQTAPHLENPPLEGGGYVPMLRAAANAISQGSLEHPQCDLDATLRVMRTVDRVRREAPQHTR